ncbi:MAG: outer membrane beta-barrel protein [Candidatus Latescibacteria bacterium]|nr:outer membrane beta-barrel protein [Candidatus Latescibacterota bacterium]
MKKVGCVGAIILIVLGFGISVEAQINRPVTIGMNFGQYRSALDFWNTQLRNEGSTKTFEQNAIFGGSLAFGITPGWRLRFDGSHWKQNVVENQALLGPAGIGTDDIAITLTPVTLSGLYSFVRISRLSMYGGGGGGVCFVKVERTRSMEGQSPLFESSTGAADFFGQTLLGADIELISGISLSGEYKYAFGSYVQQEQLEQYGQPVDRDVTISGSQFGVSLNYTFGPAIESGPSMPSLFGGGRRAIQLRPEIAIKAAKPEVRSEKKSSISEDFEGQQKELEERRKRAEKELMKLREELEEGE